MTITETRSEKVDVRVTPTAKHILQAAAAISGQKLSEFVLESAMARAAETLPDRQHFSLDAEQWKAFQAALDAPTRPLPNLAALLREPSVFER